MTTLQPSAPTARAAAPITPDFWISRARLWRFVVAMLTVVVITLLTPAWAAPVAWALFALLAVAWIIFERIPARAREAPLDDIGFWYTIAVLSYGGLPLVVWLMLGGEWTPLNDLRLFKLQPSAHVVATLGFYYALHLAAFAVAYFVVRGRSLTPPPLRVHQSDALVAFMFWMLASILLWGVTLLYPAQGTGYAESYLMVQRLPLELRQLVRLAGMMRLTLALVVLAWIFAGDRDSNREWWAYVWIAALALLTLTKAGERTSLALLVVAAMILRHRQVRPMRSWKFVTVFVVGLLAFTALGIYRGARGLEDRQAFSLGVSVGEFESVFGNAADLWTRRWDDELPHVPSTLLPSEILAPVPSQLLPFEKQDYANWYLVSLYPELQEAGGGLAFGVLAQAAIGWGVLGLILRGAALGLLFGVLRRWYAGRARSAAVTVAYLWCVVFAYQAVRSGTFSNLSAFVQFVPLTLLLVVFWRHWRRIARQVR